MYVKSKYCEGQSVPSWFLRELKFIDSNFDVARDDETGKWLIVSPAPVSVFRKGYVVEYLVEMNKQFYPLCENVLDAIRKLIKEKDSGFSLDHHLREIHEDIERRRRGAKMLRAEGTNEFYKKFNKFQTTETIDLGGK